MGRKLGTSSSIVSRKSLKPAEEISDEQLLKQALKDAERWQRNLHKGVLHSD